MPKSIFHKCLTADLNRIGEIIVAFNEYCHEHLGNSNEAEARVIDLSIALAELLNNVVLHACSAKSDHYIFLEAEFIDGILRVVLCDNGVELPSCLLEAETVRSPLSDNDELPEKGFGWFLVHQIFDVHSYDRDRTHVRCHNYLILQEKQQTTVAVQKAPQYDLIEMSKRHTLISSLGGLFFIVMAPFFITDAIASTSSFQACKAMEVRYPKLPVRKNCLMIFSYVRMDMDVHSDRKYQ